MNALLCGFYLLMSVPLGGLASWLFSCAFSPVASSGGDRRIEQFLWGANGAIVAGAGFAATVTAVLAWSL